MKFSWTEDTGAGELARAIREEDFEPIRQAAEQVRRERYGNRVYIRGLIEFTNYCKNDCLYCGIRRGNRELPRYRLTDGEILACCRQGHGLGFRTFVLQGGEDGFFTDARLCRLVERIKDDFPDCAVTLSVGERSRESYQRLFDAGADRYLLRHETFSKSHYEKLHPSDMSYENRIRCLCDLKDIGYQVGTGFMVGSPWQTAESLAEDLQFIRKFRPHMVGIGPFIPHHATPFRAMEQGSVELTLKLLSMIRLLLPDVLLPATTALGSLDTQGREKGILAGANVVMPNLSPKESRGSYQIYDNKASWGSEAAEGLSQLREAMKKIGYEVVTHRGDHPDRRENQNV